MTDFTIGLAYAMPAIPIWASYVLTRQRRSDLHKAIRDDAIDAGLIEPPSLHPVVDLNACIGCGACVLACPEGNVLGLIEDKAHLIDPTRCIGHGACKTACPADAIDLVFGTATRGVDIPYVDPSFETNVPGIYIAGELGGMGLIRNAIEQGRQAIGSIAAATKQDDRTGDMLDLLIVGAGPAGISASLAAQQAGLRCETIEQDSLGGTVAHYPRGKIAMTAPVELPGYGTLNFREISKEDLIGIWTKVVDEAGVPIAYEERVLEIVPQGVGFSIATTARTVHARRVLLAIGRRGTPRTLDVPGEGKTKVVYRLIEPEQYVGRSVLVVGGGDSAIEAAIALVDVPRTTVTLMHRGEAFDRARKKNRATLEMLVSGGRLVCCTGTKVLEIDDRHVALVNARGRAQIANDDVIVCAGGVLPTEFLRKAGVSVERKFGSP
ncbi:NAD(P)-binding domain-containing protein [Sphingomonas sp. CARO-RG-8B-R24-01]|uniref:NAD(P)-binding domain-containing protein n=1 Tax=Sphingomonas sp. CARO-RG-8B-R24-01 TaxID=2914831 RepID=UPI001F57B1C1